MKKQTITNQQCLELLQQRMCRLFWKIADEKENITIDGVPGYNEKAQFVGGKVINLCSYVTLHFAADEDERRQMLNALRSIIDMCSSMKMETWGILNGIRGLYQLKLAGLYDQAVSQAADTTLCESMDWHTFVDVNNNYALIHKPTNYYGVAFGIARYRELLGWDEPGNSAILLDHLMNHISHYSGEYGFMDETKGEGRFDRYSILIPAEITELVVSTNWTEPQLIRNMLARSARIVLKMANEEGWGFSYGRSIGAYGETAVLQILASAAQLPGLLTQDELTLAYAYSVKCIRTMILFWYDEEMQSVNMWDKGRRTDGYRNKNRILGENLSLSMQIIDVIEQWKNLGYDCAREFKDMDVLKKQPEGLSFSRFAKNEYDRGLIICRSQGHVWSLPLISGGTPYYNKDAYLPVPRENGVLEAVPDVKHCALVPKLVLEDGREAIPACFFDSIEEKGENSCQIIFKKLCLISNDSPSSLEGIEAVTTYTFTGKEILREDVFSITDSQINVKEVHLTFDTFSEDASDLKDRVIFGKGPISSIETSPYDSCQIRRLNPSDDKKGQTEQVIDLSAVGMDSYKISEDSFDTPHGPNRTSVFWKKKVEGENEIHLFWKIAY